MNKNKTIKNNFGFVHHALLGFVVIGIIVLAGVKVLTATHAQTIADVSTDSSDTDSFYAPKGDPLDISAAASTAQHPGAPQCYSNYHACYYWVTNWQHDTTATGASVVMTQAKPKLGPNDYHSVMEMMVMSEPNFYNANSPNNKIEVGWIVDHRHSNDMKPRLFVSHWVKGSPTCYNGCGFVRSKTSKIHPGSILATEKTGKFEINFKNNQWQIKYNGSLIGYFPASLWQGKFTKIHSIKVYGEVATLDSEYSPHSQMGNGKYGSKTGSAVIKNFSLINSSDSEHLQPFGTPSDPHAYDRGKSSPTGVNLGGPGY